MFSFTIFKILISLSTFLFGYAENLPGMGSDNIRVDKRTSNATSTISCVETAALTQTCQKGNIGLIIYTSLNQKTSAILDQLNKLNMTAAFFVTPSSTTDFGMLGNIARLGHVIGMLTNSAENIDVYKTTFLEKVGVCPKHIIFDSSWDGQLETISQRILNMNLYPFKWSFDPKDSIDGSTVTSVQSSYLQVINSQASFISIHSETSKLFTPSLLTFIKTTAENNNVSIVSVDQCTNVKRFWDDCTFTGSLADVKVVTNAVLFSTSVPKTSGASSLNWLCVLLISIKLL